MELTNEILENAITEINTITLGHPSTWLEKLKESAIESIRSGDVYLNDDIVYCEMQPDEYKEFKSQIKGETPFREEEYEIDLEKSIVRLSGKYIDAWNSIIAILIKYGVDKINKKWFMEHIDTNVLIDKFCEYELPKDAVVGGEWELPEWYLAGDVDAPYWRFEFAGFDGYIKSISKTDNEDQVLVEYYIYRLDHAHCDGYYSRWDSGKAIVDTKTHRRWMIK